MKQFCRSHAPGYQWFAALMSLFWMQDQAVRADTWVQWNPTNATANIQAAINSGDSRIILANYGTPWYTTPLFLTTPNQEIFFTNNATVAALSGAFQGVRDCLFTVQTNGITFNGYANGINTNAGM